MGAGARLQYDRYRRGAWARRYYSDACNLRVQWEECDLRNIRGRRVEVANHSSRAGKRTTVLVLPRHRDWAAICIFQSELLLRSRCKRGTDRRNSDRRGSETAAAADDDLCVGLCEAAGAR